jgi:UDPglucose 6-dehydrogenase
VLVATNPQCRFGVAYVPEFLRLGTAVENFRHPDRIVIGASSPRGARKIARLYATLRCPIVLADIHSAEMAKHASNAFLATSISFINEIANLCDRVGADASEVAKIMKLDPRIGAHAFLSPGLGFAGGTLGREIRALQNLGAAHTTPTPLMDAVWNINAARTRWVNETLCEMLGEAQTLDGCQIGFLGLAYKPGTSTLRRAISLDLARELTQQGARITAFDPRVNADDVKNLPLQMCADPYAVADQSVALVLLTEWADVSKVNWKRMRRTMSGDIFLDTRNRLDSRKMRAAGFRYRGVGRGNR